MNLPSPFIRDTDPGWNASTSFEQWIIVQACEGRTADPAFQAFIRLHGAEKIERIWHSWLALMAEKRMTTHPLFQAALKVYGRDRILEIWRAGKQRNQIEEGEMKE